MQKGEIAWRVAHGETPDNIKNNPALKGVTIPKTGRLGRIAPLVTKTLVVAGEGSSVTLPGGRKGTMLDAYDKATGKLVGIVPLPSQESGSPMTYMLNGRQYIVMAIGGGAYTSEFVALALPKN
jgi:quinoprotein glucose dehydrogenase